MRLALLALVVVVLVGVTTAESLTIDLMPSLFIENLGASHQVNNLTISSDQDVNNGSWVLLGSDNQVTFNLLDTRRYYSFTAGNMQQFNFTGGNYKYCYLVLTDGFEAGSTLEVHFNYSTPLQTPAEQLITPMNFTIKRPPSIQVINLETAGAIQNYTVMTNSTSIGLEWYLYGQNVSPILGDSSESPTLIDYQSSISFTPGTKQSFDISTDPPKKYYTLYLRSGLVTPCTRMEITFNSVPPAAPPAPSAAFSCSPRTGVVPLLVSCTDSSTGTFDSWSWDFGDGNTSTLQNPTNEYSWEGPFDVNLTICGTEGCDTELKSGYITVTGPTPPPTIVNPPGVSIKSIQRNPLPDWTVARFISNLATLLGFIKNAELPQGPAGPQGSPGASGYLTAIPGNGSIITGSINVNYTLLTDVTNYTLFKLPASGTLLSITPIVNDTFDVDSLVMQLYYTGHGNIYLGAFDPLIEGFSEVSSGALPLVGENAEKAVILVPTDAPRTFTQGNMTIYYSYL